MEELQKKKRTLTQRMPLSKIAIHRDGVSSIQHGRAVDVQIPNAKIHENYYLLFVYSVFSFDSDVRIYCQIRQ